MPQRRFRPILHGIVTVLIPGMAGFIGFHLARRMVELGHRVFGIDNLNRYYDVRLKLDRRQELGVTCTADHGAETITAESGLRFRRLDLTDAKAIAALRAEERFDVLCHLGAQAGVRYSLSDPFAYTANNVHGFLSILEAVRQTLVRHLVYASSNSVYGLDRHVPFSESSAADHPVSLYAATKRANELMAHSYSHLFGIPSTGLRLFTVYGPWGRPDMALFSFTRAILNGEPIYLYNDGNMERDFTYVDDVVGAVLRVIDHPPPGRPRLGRPPIRRIARPGARLQHRQRRSRVRAQSGARAGASTRQEGHHSRGPHPTRRRPAHMGRRKPRCARNSDTRPTPHLPREWTVSLSGTAATTPKVTSITGTPPPGSPLARTADPRISRWRPQPLRFQLTHHGRVPNW